MKVSTVECSTFMLGGTSVDIGLEIMFKGSADETHKTKFLIVYS